MLSPDETGSAQAIPCGPRTREAPRFDSRLTVARRRSPLRNLGGRSSISSFERIVAVLNSETVDRMLRVSAGLTLIGLAFVGPETTWGWLGIIPLLTALDGSRPT